MLTEAHFYHTTGISLTKFATELLKTLKGFSCLDSLCNVQSIFIYPNQNEIEQFIDCLSIKTNTKK